MKRVLTTIGKALSLTIVGTVLVSAKAHAADIKLAVPPTKDEPGVMTVSGPIVEGDADAFWKIAPKTGKVLVVLSGPGGLIYEALKIGSQIRMRGWYTSVAVKQECYSSCALIWVSSDYRYFRSDSPVGFHAAYKTTENGKDVESGMVNADIGSYLTHAGLQREAIQFITGAPPEKVAILSLDIAGMLGIDVIPGLEDKERWRTLRQIDVNVRAVALIISGGDRCPNIRKLPRAEGIALLSRALPPEETADFKYFDFRQKRELHKTIDQFESQNIQVACRNAATFLRNSGMGEYIKRSR